MGFCKQKKTLSEKDIENEYGSKWIWTAFSPENRLILCHLIGDRTLESCREFFGQLTRRIENKPLYVSDELVHYKTILKEMYSIEKSVPRTGKRGRPRKPRRDVDPELDYVVVHKTRENGRVVKVEQKVVFGDEERIQSKLDHSPSNKINTAYIERSNGTLRHMNSHLQRKSIKFAKEIEYLRAKLNIIAMHYNFIKPHGTLSRNPDKSYTPRTPALVAGIIAENRSIGYAFAKPMKYNNK